MKIWTDCSFDEKKKIAGIGIVTFDGEKRRVYSNYIPARSSNEGELFAIYIGAILSGGKGTVYTDSQNAISYINREIRDKERTQSQWINHKHCEFWACKIRKLGVKVEKIKAHQHNFQTHSIGNRLADLIAKEGRAKFYEK